MKKLFKNVNDVVLGVLVIIFACILLFGNVITTQPVSTTQAGYIARADTWVRIMAILMIIISVIMIIRAINFKRSDDVTPFSFIVNGTSLATLIALILYTIALPYIGFFVCTFVITFYLCWLYSIKEKGWKINTVPKGEMGKIVGKALIVAAVLLVALWLVFGKLLAVQLPGFELFRKLGIG